MKIALAQLNYTVGDVKANTAKIVDAVERARGEGADMVVFAEFAVSGTPAYGLLRKTTFLTLCEEAIDTIASKSRGIAVIVGVPYLTERGPVSAAAYISKTGQTSYIGKQHVTARREMGYIVEAETGFESIEIDGRKIMIVVGDDLSRTHDIDPDVELVVSVNARRYGKGLLSYRFETMSRLAFAEGKNLILVNQIGGSGEIVYDGTSGVLNRRGELLLMMKSFEEDFRIFDT